MNPKATITDEQFQAYLKQIRELAEGPFDEMQKEIEVTNTFPEKFYELAKENDLYRFYLPEEYGGWNLNELEILKVQEEFSRGPGGMRMHLHHAADMNWRILEDYGKQELKDQLTYLTNFTVPVAWRNQYCGVFTGNINGVTYYLLDNEYYFARNGLYGFYDDAERFIFFSRAVLELLRYIDFKPQVINANDWQTALVPVYYDIFYRYQSGYEDIKTVFTIHNIQYQGRYGLEIINDLMGIPLYHTDLLSYDGDVNFMKAAIEAADKVTTVSPSYAWEILDPWYSHGLDRILVHKQYKLCGFLNGIDQNVYNPRN